MLGVPPTIQDGDTVVAAGGRLQTTSERGAGLRVLVSSIVNLIKTGSTARSIALPDRDLTLRGVSGTQTTARLSEFDANGDQTNSNIADGITGNVWTPTGALTAARAQNVQDKAGTLALAETSDRHGFKNLLHNGRVLVDQRATLTTPSTVTTATPTYGPDGWLGNKTNATMVATIGKVAVVNTPMVGSLDACKLNVTTLASVAAGDSLSIQRRIEGTFFRRCNFGTAQAATVYVSFWAEASATGTFSVSLRNGAAARSYVTNFTITSANTRQLFQTTIPGDTSGTWATDTTNAAFLDITAAVGATFQTTAGAWQAGNFFGTSSATILNNLVGSISISDLYLGTEPIGTATSDWPHVPHDVEERRCKKYYWKTFPMATAPAQNAGIANAVFLRTISAGTANCALTVIFAVRMRSTPTLISYNPLAANAQIRQTTNTVADLTGTNFYNSCDVSAVINGVGPATAGANEDCMVHITASSEL